MNLNHVDGIRDGCALVGEAQLPISRAKKNALLETLTAYISGVGR